MSGGILLFYGAKLMFMDQSLFCWGRNSHWSAVNHAYWCDYSVIEWTAGQFTTVWTGSDRDVNWWCVNGVNRDLMWTTGVNGVNCCDLGKKLTSFWSINLGADHLWNFTAVIALWTMWMVWNAKCKVNGKVKRFIWSLHLEEHERIWFTDWISTQWPQKSNACFPRRQSR